MATPNNMPSRIMTKPVEVEAPTPKEAFVHKFVRKEHLTDRPFKNNPALTALRESLPMNRKQGKRA